jgi:signal peptidase II
LFYLIAFLVFAADQIIKLVVSSRLAPARSIPVIKGIFNLTLVRNTGVAFGLFPGQRMLLVLIGIAVCAAVIYFYSKIKREDLLFKAYLAVILGGSLGNLYDRIFYGQVIDYLDFRVFPVFNFADIAINLGVLLVILDFILGGQ